MRTALCAVGLLAVWLVTACGDEGASRGDLLLTTEEGMKVYAGELNPEAVAAAKGYEQQAVLWLGEEFRGSN